MMMMMMVTTGMPNSAEAGGSTVTGTQSMTSSVANDNVTSQTPGNVTMTNQTAAAATASPDEWLAYDNVTSTFLANSTANATANETYSSNETVAGQETTIPWWEIPFYNVEENPVPSSSEYPTGRPDWQNHCFSLLQFIKNNNNNYTVRDFYFR